MLKGVSAAASQETLHHQKRLSLENFASQTNSQFMLIHPQIQYDAER